MCLVNTTSPVKVTTQWCSVQTTEVCVNVYLVWLSSIRCDVCYLLCTFTMWFNWLLELTLSV